MGLPGDKVDKVGVQETELLQHLGERAMIARLPGPVGVAGWDSPDLTALAQQSLSPGFWVSCFKIGGPET